MSNKPKRKKSLGIISGAGPMAGVILMKQLIEAYQAKGAYLDEDFPYISLINYPFTNMLCGNYDNKTIQKELLNCINSLESSCDYILIACQTLHLFLPEYYENSRLINIVSILNEFLPAGPLYIAASKTSADSQMHAKWLNRECSYINPKKTQFMIDEILKGKRVNMTWLEEFALEKTVLLGCTELSIPIDGSSTSCIDPYPHIVKYVTRLLELECKETVC